MQKHTKPLPSLDTVRRLLNYDPETGVFRWRISIGKAAAGMTAGCTASGYILIGIHGRLIKAHRLAWLMHYGVEPMGDIDHVNGVRSDNRICNLREASHSQNMHNRRADHDNKSGIKGVCWNKWKNKWMAYVNGKHLGYFDQPEKAAEEVKRVRRLVHGQFACDRV